MWLTMRKLADAFPEVAAKDRAVKKLPCAGRRGDKSCPSKVEIRIEGCMPTVAVMVRKKQLSGDVPVFCETCEERQDREDRERLERERLEELRRGRVEHAGVPERWAQATFEELDRGPDRTAGIEAAERWSMGVGPRGVLLHGPVGRGKSHIAAAAARRRCTLSPVKWLNIAELLRDLSMPIGHPQRARALSILSGEKAAGKAALILDDFDKGRRTDFGIEVLYLAVNAWTEAQRPLFVTLNHDLDWLAEDLGERYGEAVSSRLAGYCEICEIGGEDRRLL